LERQREMQGPHDGFSSVRLVPPVADSTLHHLLMILVRFGAWLRGSVYTAGALAVVFRDDGAVLLVKPRYRRGWGLPGGFMKRGEQSTDTVRREVREETGIAIDVDRMHEVYVQQKRRRIGHIDHLFVAQVSSQHDPKPQTRFEISAVSWFLPNDLPPLQPEAHEALRRARGN
jgi:ADP-ribose pyrophosphatase YjhB (NUDIX family)